MAGKEFSYSYTTDEMKNTSPIQSSLTSEDLEHGYVSEDTSSSRINQNNIPFRSPTIERDDSALGYTDTCSQDQSQSQDDFKPSLPPPSKKKTWSSTAGVSEIFRSLNPKKKEEVSPLHRDWNEEFQSLMEQTFPDSEREVQRTKSLRLICEEFALLAAQVGKMIISELFVDLSKKKIPPITDRVGGVAGGAKFFYEGIFFKFPLDDYDIYDDEEGIMKCAGHELRGLKHLLDCRVKGLHYPLMVLCDYRGYRLLAESLLPLGKDSLVYGSSDAGRNLKADNPEMNANIELISKMLNLQGEYVWNLTKTEKTFLHLSCDIEGHIGKDGRAYLVDFARLWPPTTPRSGTKGDFLVCQMRPELVRSNPVPLCSDSFSGFGLENKAFHNEEVREATSRLENEIIPDFAVKLDRVYDPSLNVSASIPKNSTSCIENIIVEMHRQGINIRYLGLLRSRVECEELRSFILTEIIARVIKNYSRSEMRKLQTSQESAYIQLLLQILNSVFGSHSYSKVFWVEKLLPMIQKRFTRSLTEEEVKSIESSGGAKIEIQWCVLFLRLQTLLGIRFHKDFCEAVLMEYETDPNNGILNYPSRIPFDKNSIEEMYPIVKHIHRIFFEEGTALSRMAITQSSDELFAQAEEKYKESLQSKPNDYRSLSNWGLSIMMQALYKMKERGSTSEISRMFTQAQEKFKKAIEIFPNDYKTLNKWGNCLLSLAGVHSTDTKLSASYLESACEKYSQAHQIYPDDFEILFNWGNAILAQARLCTNDSNVYIDKLSSACDKYSKANVLKTDSYEVLRNWAASLSKLARVTQDRVASTAYFEEAYHKYKEVAALRSGDHEVYFNWANSLYHQACMPYMSQIDAKPVLINSAEQYFHSLKLKPDFFHSLNNWTRVLIHLASIVKLENLQGSNEGNTELSGIIDNFINSFKTLTLTGTTLPREIAVIVDYVKMHPQLDKTGPRFLNVLKDLATTGSYRIDDDHQDTSFAATAKKRKSVDIHKSMSEESLSTVAVQGFLFQLSEKLQSIMIAESKASQEQFKEEDFEWMEIIGGGKGSFATIFKAKKKIINDDTIYAIKVIRKDLLAPNQVVLQHPYIVEMHSQFSDDRRAYFVYEYLPGMQILQLAKERKRISEDRARFYAAELVLAIEHFHSNQIVYRSLSPENILLDKYGHIKVIQKLLFVEDKGSQAFEASLEYMAPEILEGKEDGMAVDWWSLGIIIYLFFTGTTPFAASQMNDIIEKIMAFPVIFPKDVPATAQALVLQLLNRDENQRIEDVKNIRAHPFFSSIDWKQLEERKLEPPYKLADERYKITFPDAEMSDTVVIPNFAANFMGYTFAQPKQKQ